MKLDLYGETVAGLADGIRCDRDGNIWASAGGLEKATMASTSFRPKAKMIGQIVLPIRATSLGGPRRNRLFMTASRSLYAVYTENAHWC